MRILVLALFVYLISQPCFAKETIIDCKNIDQYLPDCLKMKCSTISKAGETITQEILGFDKNGKCVHNQYQPDGKIMNCAYSEESRKFLSLQIKNSKFEPNRKINEDIKNKLTPVYEPDLVEQIFSNECVITKKK